MSDPTTRTLTAVLDRFVDQQAAFVAPVAEVRTRATRARRRRATAAAVAVAVAITGLGASVWAVRRDPEPSSLVVTGGVLRLNDWITLTWVPDDVVGVEASTHPASSMSRFGYWQGNFRLSRGVDDPIIVHVTLGDPFDAEAEVALSDGRAWVEAGRVVTVLSDGRTSILARVGSATVRVIGDDPAAVRRLLDAAVVGEPDVTIPGNPIVLAEGLVDGVPWDLRVTTPSDQDAERVLDQGGTCLVLRVYTAAEACDIAPESGVTALPIWLPWEDRPIGTFGTTWVLRATDGVVAFEYTLGDGTIGRIAATSAAPASGVFAVLDTGAPVGFAEVRAVLGDGTTLQELEPGFTLP